MKVYEDRDTKSEDEEQGKVTQKDNRESGYM